MKQLPRVKICGMKSADDIGLAVSLGADAVGFITEVPVNTPRKVDAQTAAELVKTVPFFVDSVLVIMPSSGQDALDLIDKVKPDVVQLHNDISAEEIEIIRDGTHQKLIRTFTIPVESKELPADLMAQVDALLDNDLIDGILLDSGKAGATGGTGMVHDWSISRQVVENTKAPVILAGGLKPDNVRDAVKEVRPFAVDTASGVESNGKKDPAKVCRFIEEARCING
ncbi:phosphoribosylanthranilate isomerase [Methanolobus mangrovi]|uniref:N-(5'-phosphoribosyl)anthranilate isomerase n=1 Tax=Methanolobus mangrovi TaxID=3072977 RepID=A0AA51UH02_9EURY|nr:phosphoribosylanthranilate isomerase [Methanolobus mangrovi]WMW21982.1 phosphoribosylanthranilate isomerase [Methanolobus mangrovi]